MSNIKKPNVAELLDYYGKDVYGNVKGFIRACVKNAGEIQNKEKCNGFLYYIEEINMQAIMHCGMLYQVTDHELTMFNLRASFNKQNLGDYFMLYQALEDILKINRFDMADPQHDEVFKFAQEVINKFRKNGN